MRKHLTQTHLGRIKWAFGFLIVVCLATLGLVIHNALRAADLAEQLNR